MLAAIQRYVPGLVCGFCPKNLIVGTLLQTSNLYTSETHNIFLWQIPSTYGPERLDLLRQLEKVKEMESSEVDPDENAGLDPDELTWGEPAQIVTALKI